MVRATDALDAIRRHAEAINDRDLTAYQGSTAFPFTYQNYNGVALTIEAEGDCGVSAPHPWDLILETDPSWSHTVFDVIEEILSSTTSAVFRMQFRRVDGAGNSSDSYQAIWIATQRSSDGPWGVQLRHNLGLVER